MSMDILIMNSNVIRLLEKDMQDLAQEFSKRGGFRTLLEEIRDEVLRPSIEKNFEVGGRPKRWEPLAMATVGMGREEYIASGGGTIGGRLPLTNTGQMRRAATAKARFHIANNQMTYGSWPPKRWFGPVHNMADIAARAQIPHRPFTLIQSEDQVAIQEITGEWVEDKVNKHIKRHYR